MDVAAADEGQGGVGAGAGGGGTAGAGDAQCVICMTEVERHEAGVQLPCSHLFHGKYLPTVLAVTIHTHTHSCSHAHIYTCLWDFCRRDCLTPPIPAVLPWS